jgi:hypothetical protein
MFGSMRLPGLPETAMLFIYLAQRHLTVLR